MDNEDIQGFQGYEMPHSIEAEQCVLGAILCNTDLLPSTMDYLKPESFYIENHKRLYSVMLRLFSSANAVIDAMTVLDAAVTDGIFEDSASGNQYLAQIMESVPSLSNIESYCRIVEEKYYLRSLAQASRMIFESCIDSNENAESALDNAEQMIYDIRRGKEVNGLTRIDEVLVEAYDRLGKISGPDREKYQGAKSGYADLDRLISGLNKSDLIILAARPGMGKTSFAMNLAANVCRNDITKEVVIFSLEMSKEQIVTRMLSSESLVPSDVLMKGEISPEDWVKLAEGADRITNMNMYLDDTAGITTVGMKAKLRRRNNLGLVIIDYLQLMNSSRRIDNRVNEISEITRQLKLMAKELDVPLIVLSQLSRAVESRNDKHPQLSDLRESGSIEQDADIVMFLYRDGYYNRDTTDDVNRAECIIAKNRHGETGTVNLRWNGEFTRFFAEDRRIDPSPV